jgi:aldehyde dehydrogenase (NAD+)
MMEGKPVTHPFLAGGPKRLLIDGANVDALSGRTFQSRNPATGELLAEIAEGDAEDIDLAVRAARRAFDEGPWRRVLPAERQAILLRLADLLEKEIEDFALLDTLDMGAPIRHTRGSGAFLISLLRYYAGMARGLHGETLNPSIPGMFACTLREPVGVVGAITPWNGPLWAAVLKIGPVLATGCTLVLKPAEDSPLSALRLGELVLEAGAPPGVVNVVPGFGATAGAALAAHGDVDKVAFTGSAAMGRKIVQASAGNLKRLSLELGGKSPNIVFADADLKAAAPSAAIAAFANSGQICSAGTRLFVERGIYDDFIAEVAAFGATLKLGDGRDPGTDLGPLVSARQRERVEAYLHGARNDGAHVFSGGGRPEGAAFAQGYFVSPTVLTGVSEDMRVVQEEVFGPVLAAMPFDTIEEVTRRANATPFGLGAGVWTHDGGKALRMARDLRAGSVWVNAYNVLDPAIPAGGFKESGYGREYGVDHLNDHMNVKSLWMKMG